MFCYTGYYAFRRAEGSWFVQSIKKAVDVHGADEELARLMTRANNYMNDFRAESDHPVLDGSKQSMWVASTLTHDIYFK